jgi:hypothetical protein
MYLNFEVSGPTTALRRGRRIGREDQANDRTCSQCPAIQCNPKPSSQSKGGINPGVIAGPVVAVLVIASLALFWFLRRKKVCRHSRPICVNRVNCSLDRGGICYDLKTLLSERAKQNQQDSNYPTLLLPYLHLRIPPRCDPTELPNYLNHLHLLLVNHSVRLFLPRQSTQSTMTKMERISGCTAVMERSISVKDTATLLQTVRAFQQLVRAIQRISFPSSTSRPRQKKAFHKPPGS